MTPGGPTPPSGEVSRPAVKPSRRLPSRARTAFLEMVDALLDATTWTALAHRDIKARYRRTVIGPFWIVVLALVSAAAIAAIYGVLLNKPFLPYFVFVLASLVSWTLVSTVLSESASILWLSATLIKTYHISPVTLVLANIWKNFIVWCHAIAPAIIGAFLVLHGDASAVLFLPVGLLLVMLNLGWIALMVALLGARFRDVHELVITLMTLAFLVTPVIWDAPMLGAFRALADFNPLASLLDLLRRPVLGDWPTRRSVVVAIVGAAVGWLLAARYFKAARSPLSLWI